MPASGPSADRSGVLSPSTTEKARPSNHRPAPHSDNIALVHTPVTAAPAACPTAQKGLIGRHGSEASPAAGSPGVPGKAHAGAVEASDAPTTRTTARIRRRADRKRWLRCCSDMAELPVAGDDRRLGARPDRRSGSGLGPGADHPPVARPLHAL